MRLKKKAPIGATLNECAEKGRFVDKKKREKCSNNQLLKFVKNRSGSGKKNDLLEKKRKTPP